MTHEIEIGLKNNVKYTKTTEPPMKMWAIVLIMVFT